MSNQKDYRFRPALYDRNSDERRSPNRRSAASESNSKDNVRSEQQGWDAYRKWLSHANMPPAHRSPLDASIYSWRGYNNWADKVRQTWKVDEPTDS